MAARVTQFTVIVLVVCSALQSSGTNQSPDDVAPARRGETYIDNQLTRAEQEQEGHVSKPFPASAGQRPVALQPVSPLLSPVHSTVESFESEAVDNGHGLVTAAQSVMCKNGVCQTKVTRTVPHPAAVSQQESETGKTDEALLRTMRADQTAVSEAHQLQHSIAQQMQHAARVGEAIERSTVSTIQNDVSAMKNQERAIARQFADDSASQDMAWRPLSLDSVAQGGAKAAPVHSTVQRFESETVDNGHGPFTAARSVVCKDGLCEKKVTQTMPHSAAVSQQGSKFGEGDETLLRTRRSVQAAAGEAHQLQHSIAEQMQHAARVEKSIERSTVNSIQHEFRALKTDERVMARQLADDFASHAMVLRPLSQHSASQSGSKAVPVHSSVESFQSETVDNGRGPVTNARELHCKDGVCQKQVLHARSHAATISEQGTPGGTTDGTLLRSIHTKEGHAVAAGNQRTVASFNREMENAHTQMGRMMQQKQIDGLGGFETSS